MSEDKTVELKKRTTRMDTPDLRIETGIDPHHKSPKPWVQSTEPETPEEAEIQNLRDAVEPTEFIKERFSDN